MPPRPGETASPAGIPVTCDLFLLTVIVKEGRMSGDNPFHSGIQGRHIYSRTAFRVDLQHPIQRVFILG
ncbi:MAG: hypothetical protein DRH37_05170 [Deltaproteobacteria bacterium]|nr:MAG: hypothetical protein DRH37_05170 [Deltaproteobacteria bacterium]